MTVLDDKPTPQHGRKKPSTHSRKKRSSSKHRRAMRQGRMLELRKPPTKRQRHARLMLQLERKVKRVIREKEAEARRAA